MGGRGQRTSDRGQKTDGRSQRTDDGGQKLEVGMWKSASGPEGHKGLRPGGKWGKKEGEKLRRWRRKV